MRGSGWLDAERGQNVMFELCHALYDYNTLWAGSSRRVRECFETLATTRFVWLLIRVPHSFAPSLATPFANAAGVVVRCSLHCILRDGMLSSENHRSTAHGTRRQRSAAPRIAIARTVRVYFAEFEALL